MATLLLAEVHGGHLVDTTAKALTAAKALGQPVDRGTCASRSA